MTTAVNASISAKEKMTHGRGVARKTESADDRVLARLFGHSDTRSLERY